MSVPDQTSSLEPVNQWLSSVFAYKVVFFIIFVHTSI